MNNNPSHINITIFKNSELICTVNQVAGFYMSVTLA